MLNIVFVFIRTYYYQTKLLKLHNQLDLLEVEQHLQEIPVMNDGDRVKTNIYDI